MELEWACEVPSTSPDISNVLNKYWLLGPLMCLFLLSEGAKAEAALPKSPRELPVFKVIKTVVPNCCVLT